jgi:hypothetical protein
MPHPKLEAKLNRSALRCGSVRVSLKQAEFSAFCDELEKLAFAGLPVEVEAKRGENRTGRNRHGQTWSRVLTADYGFIKGTMGMDREPVDVYIGRNLGSTRAFVVHQLSPNGMGYDEDKVMLGFTSEEEAKKVFIENAHSPRAFGGITTYSTGDLYRRAKSGTPLIGGSGIRQVQESIEANRKERREALFGKHANFEYTSMQVSGQPSIKMRWDSPEPARKAPSPAFASSSSTGGHKPVRQAMSEEEKKKRRQAYYRANRAQILQQSKAYKRQNAMLIKRKQKKYRRLVSAGAIRQRKRVHSGMGYQFSGYR